MSVLSWFAQVTLWSGSCGSVSLRRVAGNLCTTLTPTRSACPTVDVHGMRNTVWYLFYCGCCCYCLKLTTVNVKICLRNGLCVPATLEAVIPAARSRFGLWSWAMQETIISGLRQTSHWGDGPPLTLSGWMWQVAPHKLKLLRGLLQPVFLYMRNSQSVFRPPGSGASSTACQHVRLGRDRVCWLSGNRMRCSREEPRAVQVCLIHVTQLYYWQGWKNAADLLIKTPVCQKDSATSKSNQLKISHKPYSSRVCKLFFMFSCRNAYLTLLPAHIVWTWFFQINRKETGSKNAGEKNGSLTPIVNWRKCRI